VPEQILDNTPFLLAHCSRDLRYVYVSKSYAAMLGRSADDIVGKPIVDFIGEEGFEAILPHIERVLRGQRVEYEAAHMTHAGTRQHYVIYVPEHDERNQVIGWIASIFDITELKKATEEKERLEKLIAEMRLPLESANIGMWDWDMRGDNVSCTPELEAIYGLQATGLRSFADFRKRVHPDDIHEVLARRDAAIGARTTFQLEYRIIRPDGQIRWLMSVGGAVYDKVTGEPTRLMGSIVDITETKANEVQAERNRKELAHLMRVATLGGLSGGIAHELNQPLASILANAQAAQGMLAKNNPDWEGLAEILQEIVEEDMRAGQVIRDLRKMLQKGEHREAHINLNGLILSTLQLLHSELLTRTIKVDTELKTDLAVLSGDSAELQQVLINLIMNAIEAMGSTPPSQRTLSIATQETKEGYVEVSIRDWGPGMSVGQLKRIFEPFFTTKAGGLGLGLSICSNIITLHRGQLTLREAPGGGMVATVLLPKSVQLAIAS
jgi:PAS domain S-box-containing protein